MLAVRNMKFEARTKGVGSVRYLDFSPAFDGLEHRDLVRILNVTACGNSRGDSRDFQPRPAELPAKIGGGRLALHGRISSQNNFFYLPVRDSGQQIRDSQLLRSDPMNRGDRTVQNVVNAVVVPRLLNDGDVGGLFDHANEALVPRWAGTIAARIDVGNIVTN